MYWGIFLLLSSRLHNILRINMTTHFKYDNSEILVIRNHFYNYDLLQLFKSDLLDDNHQLGFIYNMAFMDDLNPYVVDLTKGLKW